MNQLTNKEREDIEFGRMEDEAYFLSYSDFEEDIYKAEQIFIEDQLEQEYLDKVIKYHQMAEYCHDEETKAEIYRNIFGYSEEEEKAELEDNLYYTDIERRCKPRYKKKTKKQKREKSHKENFGKTKVGVRETKPKRYYQALKGHPTHSEHAEIVDLAKEVEMEMIEEPDKEDEYSNVHIVQLYSGNRYQLDKVYSNSEVAYIDIDGVPYLYKWQCFEDNTKKLVKYV